MKTAMLDAPAAPGVVGGVDGASSGRSSKLSTCALVSPVKVRVVPGVEGPRPQWPPSKLHVLVGAPVAVVQTIPP